MGHAGTGRRGSIRQSTNGTWFFVVDITQPGGERRQTRRRGFATRREAQRELTRVLTSVDDRAYVEPKRQTVGTFLTETWLPAVEHTIKPSTFESYRRNVRLHISGRSIGRRRLQQVGAADLNALYASLLAGDEEHRPLSPRSVAYVATILHRALRDAVRWHAIVRNPADAADPPRPSSKPEMRTWKAHELAGFLTGVADDRLAGAWWLLATTGMRRGEVLGLRWQDVDLDAGRLSISRTLITTDVQRIGEPGMAWGTPKTGKGRRQVALDPSTVAALRTHRKPTAAGTARHRSRVRGWRPRLLSRGRPPVTSEDVLVLLRPARAAPRPPENPSSRPAAYPRHPRPSSGGSSSGGAGAARARQCLDHVGHLLPRRP